MQLGRERREQDAHRRHGVGHQRRSPWRGRNAGADAERRTAPQIEMLAIDRGRGMEDVDRSCGTATAPAGPRYRARRSTAALDQVRHLSRCRGEQWPFTSGQIGSSPLPAPPLHSGVCIALPGEIECGDTWRIADRGALGVMVADGLGHGWTPPGVARSGRQAFSSGPFASVTVMLSPHTRPAGHPRAAVAAARG